LEFNRPTELKRMLDYNRIYIQVQFDNIYNLCKFWTNPITERPDTWSGFFKISIFGKDAKRRSSNGRKKAEKTGWMNQMAEIRAKFLKIPKKFKLIKNRDFFFYENFHHCPVVPWKPWKSCFRVLPKNKRSIKKSWIFVAWMEWCSVIFMIIWSTGLPENLEKL
jgi:hypothetical protein